MKGLLVSDLHYTLKQFDWLIQVAGDYELVVIAGDHLDVASSVTYDAQILVVLKYLRRLSAQTRLIVCSGNHDLNARDGNGEKTAAWMQRCRRLGIACDGENLTLGDTLVTICPWWDGPKALAQIKQQIESDSALAHRRWIWIYHAPPDDSPVSWAGKRHFGDSELSSLITKYEPDLVMTGHIHQSPFKPDGSWFDRIGKTWVFNPGRQIGPVPTHIEFDLDARTATWRWMEGIESVDLSAPAETALLSDG
jgi:Icc-related predicted phosphoesterase